MGAIQQASRLIGYSVSKLDVGGVACMELRFDSSAGSTFSDAKCDTTHALRTLLSFPLKSPCRYCVIQWLDERGCCVVKSHNLPYWLMTDDVKQKLVTQGVAVFARAVCAMLRCHERRKGAVALLQKCPAITKVSSTSVSFHAGRLLASAARHPSRHPPTCNTRRSCWTAYTLCPLQPQPEYFSTP